MSEGFISRGFRGRRQTHGLRNELTDSERLSQNPTNCATRLGKTEKGEASRRVSLPRFSLLIMRSKSYWGYDPSFLEACRPILTLKTESIEHDPVYCAEVGGTVAGVSHLKKLDGGEVCLDDLFVEPAFIGQGIGGLLWRHAVDMVKAMGAKSLVFGADPHARPFYEHMGAVVEGYNLSTILPGRRTPRMRYEW